MFGKTKNAKPPVVRNPVRNIDDHGFHEFGAGAASSAGRRNISDPIAWAAKLAFEEKLTERGQTAARAFRAIQLIDDKLLLNPERGKWARFWARTVRGAINFLHLWRWVDGPMWDLRRDGLLTERAVFERSIGAEWLNETEALRQRAEQAIDNAPLKKKVDYVIRDQGFEAARNGLLDIKENPYEPGTIEHHSWQKGWKQGTPSGGFRKRHLLQ